MIASHALASESPLTRWSLIRFIFYLCLDRSGMLRRGSELSLHVNINLTEVIKFHMVKTGPYALRGFLACKDTDECMWDTLGIAVFIAFDGNF
jgi:hypothetical protein